MQKAKCLINPQVYKGPTSIGPHQVGWPPAGQFSSTCGELVAFAHLEGSLGPLDSCMESCIVRDNSC